MILYFLYFYIHAAHVFINLGERFGNRHGAFHLGDAYGFGLKSVSGENHGQRLRNLLRKRRHAFIDIVFSPRKLNNKSNAPRDSISNLIKIRVTRCDDAS